VPGGYAVYPPEELSCEQRPPTPRQAPWRLTSEEILQLMQAFTSDKCLIVESDALALCHWAERCQRSAWALALVLDGQVSVQVEDGQVQLERPGSRN